MASPSPIFVATLRAAVPRQHAQQVIEADPRTWRRAAEARLDELHDAMLAIIATLDAVDGDTDLEPSICGSLGPGWVPITDDREGGDVLDEGEPNDWDDEAGGDDEPTLGWSPNGIGSVALSWSDHLFSAAVDHDK